MILGAWFFDWLSQIALCVTHRWPDCAAPCWFPCAGWMLGNDGDTLLVRCYAPCEVIEL